MEGLANLKKNEKNRFSNFWSAALIITEILQEIDEMGHSVAETLEKLNAHGKEAEHRDRTVTISPVAFTEIQENRT